MLLYLEILSTRLNIEYMQIQILVRILTEPYTTQYIAKNRVWDLMVHRPRNGVQGSWVNGGECPVCLCLGATCVRGNFVLSSVLCRHVDNHLRAGSPLHLTRTRRVVFLALQRATRDVVGRSPVEPTNSIFALLCLWASIWLGCN